MEYYKLITEGLVTGGLRRGVSDKGIRTYSTGTMTNRRRYFRLMISQNTGGKYVKNI